MKRSICPLVKLGCFPAGASSPPLPRRAGVSCGSSRQEARWPRDGEQNGEVVGCSGGSRVWVVPLPEFTSTRTPARRCNHSEKMPTSNLEVFNFVQVCGAAQSRGARRTRHGTIRGLEAWIGKVEVGEGGWGTG